jgi:DNA-binding protein HU-beta
MATRKVGAKKKRMTQSEVIKHFEETIGMKRAQVKVMLDELSALAAREVKSSGQFILPGLGKLVKSERKARAGRNPATGETLQIPAKTTLKFRVGKAMKDTVLPRRGSSTEAVPRGGGDILGKGMGPDGGHGSGGPPD